jgi:hypothetical protein
MLKLNTFLLLASTITSVIGQFEYLFCFVALSFNVETEHINWIYGRE